jgi:hypothetical protein
LRKSDSSVILEVRALQTPTLNDAQQDNNNRDDQENVNEAAHRGRRDESEQPKDDKDYCDCFKHLASPRDVITHVFGTFTHILDYILSTIAYVFDCVVDTSSGPLERALCLTAAKQKHR